MIRNLLTCAILAFFSALSLSTLSAQQETEQHKIVIIEKEIDENGKVIEKKIIKEGAEAEAYMKKINLDGDHMKEGGAEKKIKIVQKEAYEIESEDENGAVKILKWDGEGEMPEEMKELMEKEGMLEDLESGNHVSRVRVKRKSAGLEDVLDFEFDGDELPDDVREILEKEGIEIEQVTTGEGMKELRIISKSKHEEGSDGKKAQLGVNIEDHPNGVRISNVLPDSSADEGGLKAGDIITAVDGTSTKDIQALVGKIATYRAGDKITVAYLRGGKEETSAFVLKEKKELFPFKTWKEVMDHNKEETLEIEIEKEISKGNK